MVDIDGNSTYTQAISVEGVDMSSQTFNLAPNPAKNNATLYFVADAPGAVQISLLNLAGVQVYSQTGTVSQGQNALSIQSIDRLAKGVYIVRMVTGNQTACTKLLVE